MHSVPHRSPAPSTMGTMPHLPKDLLTSLPWNMVCRNWHTILIFLHVCCITLAQAHEESTLPYSSVYHTLWAAKIAPPDSPAEGNSLHDPASCEHSHRHCLQLKLFGDHNCNGQLEPKPIQTGSKKISKYENHSVVETTVPPDMQISA